MKKTSKIIASRWPGCHCVEGRLIQETALVNSSDTQQRIAFFATPVSTLHKI